MKEFKEQQDLLNAGWRGISLTEDYGEWKLIFGKGRKDSFSFLMKKLPRTTCKQISLHVYINVHNCIHKCIQVYKVVYKLM